jgi:hypothetical protein
VPNAPEIFLEREQPQVEIQLNTGGRGIGDGVFEVILTVTVTAIEDETIAWSKWPSGIFRIQNVPDEQLEPLIAVACPNHPVPHAAKRFPTPWRVPVSADHPAARQFRGHVHAASAAADRIRRPAEVPIQQG